MTLHLEPILQIDGPVSDGEEIDESTWRLEARGVGRRAGDRWLLRDISLEVPPGARLAIVGPSGSGKTLLLRALALLDPLDAGEILWCGQPVRGRDVPRFRSRVVYLHQRPPLMEGTVEGNLRQPFEFVVHRDRAFDRDWIIAQLRTLTRDASFLDQQARQLSGGEAQLTALLRAMQLGPDVLLLDEPTAALDAAAKQTVETLIEQWRGERPEQRTTVWVTHDERQVEQVADRVIRLQGGVLNAE